MSVHHRYLDDYFPVCVLSFQVAGGFVRVLGEKQRENAWGEGERHFAFVGITVKCDVISLLYASDSFRVSREAQ